MTTRENLKKYRKIYYKKPTKKRAGFLQSVFSLLMIWQLIVWQLLLPMNLRMAVAAAPADGPPPASDESVDSTQTPDENSDAPQDQADDKPEDLWKTCKLDDMFDEVSDDKVCDKCKEKTSCDEIETCLKEEVKIENDANVDNEVATSSNTGENKIEVGDNDQKPADVQTQNDENINSPDSADSGESEADNSQENNDQLAETADENQDSANQPENAAPELDAENSDSQSENNNAKTEKDPQPENISPDASINTGDATSISNVSNEVNTTVVGSDVSQSVQNIEGDYTGDINLLDSFNNLIENGKNLNSDNQSALGSLNISVENDADVENDVTTTADTGQNEIASESDHASAAITTGDAAAIVNVANVVNTTIIGNNILFTVINIFGNWVGNLIVPGEGLLDVLNNQNAVNSDITIENDANIDNDVETSATTGDNEIDTEDGDASIQTGDAAAVNTVVNQTDTTVIGDNWFFLVVNNMGNWVGSVLNWNEDSGSYENVYSYDFGQSEEPDSNDMIGWIQKIFIKNDADINNNVETSANTGGNEIDSDGGNATIKTGNATAFAKIYNLINTNLIGNNWMFSVVNIFGSWQGNLEFAYPDLSVTLGDDADHLRAGDSYSYHVKVKNDGHADCDRIQLALDLPGEVNADGDGSWALDQLKAGEEREFDLKVNVPANIPTDVSTLEAKAAVATETKEVELGNNVASDEVKIYKDSDGSDSQNSNANQEHPALFVTRTVSEKKIQVGDVTKHTIIAENTGDTSLDNVIVTDKIRNKKGTAGEYYWTVGTLNPGQKAIITYKLMVNTDAPLGKYHNSAVAVGYDSVDQEVRSNESGTGVTVSGLDDEDQSYYYYTYYYTYPYPQQSAISVFDGDSFIPTAEAAGPDQGKVLGAWTRDGDVCQALPWWGWAAAAILYLGSVHWSLLRQKRIIQPVKKK